ncbi:DUF3327 domain-containing protein [Kocuria coralli]|uniref:DUF3327 domain-containing protein n=1 Tax=Kocuria coralli TaxID=1461025 RepID=A0A5J5KZ64_9MICC|nr:enterochelin esterase domain-containing protein [Kocuria coralli]KAA9394964.1 DUF3327 domain-containing protein [Kocuria coralli]
MHATTPGTDDQGGRTEDVTFTWDDAQAERVHLTMNRVTDKADYERGLMHRVPGTDTWPLTLRLPTALRASYGFTPLGAGE